MSAAHPKVEWHLPPCLAKQLLKPGGLPLAEWLAAGVAAVIKDAPHRRIYRVILGELDFHLKEYRTVGVPGWLREMARPIKAKTEFERGTPDVLGVPAPKPLGWGVLGSATAPRASFLLTETVAGAQPLEKALHANLLPSVRQQLAIALGAFLARLHATGVVHRDLHPGNLLVKFDEIGRVTLYLVDLHEARVGGRASWSDRRANLIVFNRYFILRASRSDRLRFWHAYMIDAGSAIPDHPAAGPKALEEATWRSNFRFWIDRESRCANANRHFRTISGAGIQGYAVREIDDRSLADLLANPDAAFTAPGVKLLKAGGVSTVAELNLPLVDGPVVWKRFGKASFANAIKNTFRPSGARRSWVLGHGLIDAGLPTARPLAVIHRTRFGLPAGGFLLTAKIEDAMDLREFVDSLATFPAERRRDVLRARIDSLARLMRAFHRRSFVHRDLKAANLLTCADPNDGRIWFIDLVGVRRRWRVAREARVRDLARLSASFHNHPNVSRTDKLRFLRVYRDWATRGNWGWQRWWRELSEATEAKIARNIRTGRPLA